MDTSSTFIPDATPVNGRNCSGLRSASSTRSASVRMGFAMIDATGTELDATGDDVDVESPFGVRAVVHPVKSAIATMASATPGNRSFVERSPVEAPDYTPWRLAARALGMSGVRPIPAGRGSAESCIQSPSPGCAREQFSWARAYGCRLLRSAVPQAPMWISRLLAIGDTSRSLPTAIAGVR